MMFDPRKIKLAKEHFKHFHPRCLGRSLVCSKSNSHGILPANSYPLSSDPSFNLRSWQIVPGIYEDTLYLCPWCLLEEKRRAEGEVTFQGGIWSSRIFLQSDYFNIWVQNRGSLLKEDITRISMEHRDHCGFNSIRELAVKGPDAAALERIRDEDISNYELDPREEAIILEPLHRERFPFFFQREPEEDGEDFFDAVDDSPESGWESMEGLNSSREEEHLLGQMVINNDDLHHQESEEDTGSEEDESSSIEEEEPEEEESFESEIDPVTENSLNIEQVPPIFMSESERFHKEWLQCQNKIRDLKIHKYIQDRLKSILSVAFAPNHFVAPLSRAQAFEKLPNMNRDENGQFEIVDMSELQDLCYLSFVMREEKFLP